MKAPLSATDRKGEPRGSPFLFTVAKKSSIIIGRFYKERVLPNMIAFEEHKAKLNDLKPKLVALADSLGLDRARDELERLHAQAASEGFGTTWRNPQKVLQKPSSWRPKSNPYEKMQAEWEDLYTIFRRWRWRKMTTPCWTSCSPALKRWNR